MVVSIPKPRKTGQTDLRNFFGKRERVAVTKGDIGSDDDDEGASGSKRPKFCVEIPIKIPGPLRTESHTAASSITRSPPPKMSTSKRTSQKYKKGSDSDSDFKIQDEEEEEMLAAADEMDILSDAVEEVSEDVESVKAEEDEDEDILMLEEEEKPKKKSTARKSISKTGESLKGPS